MLKSVTAWLNVSPILSVRMALTYNFESLCSSLCNNPSVKLWEIARHGCQQSRQSQHCGVINMAHVFSSSVPLEVTINEQSMPPYCAWNVLIVTLAKPRDISQILLTGCSTSICNRPSWSWSVLVSKLSLAVTVGPSCPSFPRRQDASHWRVYVTSVFRSSTHT